MRRITLALILLLVGTAVPGAVEAENPPPEELEMEGIYLGQSFADVDRLLDLQNYTPVTSDDGERYTWHPPRDIHDLDTLDTEGDLALRLRKIELVFRDERVSEVRASYATAASFGRLGPDLKRRYGEPSSVLAPPKRSVQGMDGRPYSLFLQIWTWQWDDVTLTVTGEHYRGPQGLLARSGTHLDFFRFHLSASTGDSP